LADFVRGGVLKPKVYLETSVISYLAGRVSRDVVTVANQQVTRTWWRDGRSDFELYVSRVVLLEIGAGDLSVARSRLDLVREIPRLDLTQECFLLAEELLQGLALPRVTAGRDALHIAVAAMNGVDFLLTWNCRHIANAVLIPRIASIIERRGYRAPVLCTPPQLMGR